MSFEIVFVFALVVMAMALFASEIVSFDLVALSVAGLLMISGVLTPSEGFSGFSNPATVTIGAMFVVSEGVRKTGFLDEISDWLSGVMKFGFFPSLLILMTVIAVISGIINNTAAIVIFIPVIMKLAGEIGVSPSKLLMPLSFASMFGGVCTLIGTSTNILVSSIAGDRDLAPIGMFEMTPLGVIIVLAGFVYLFTAGIRIIPARRKEEDLSESFNMNEHLTEIVIDKDSEHIGAAVEAFLADEKPRIEIVNLFRDGKVPESFRSRTALREGDVLRLRGNADQIARFVQKQKVKGDTNKTKMWCDVDLKKGNFALVEAVIAPDSFLASKKIKHVNFSEKFGAVVLGVRSNEKIKHENLEEMQLSGGDSLLLSMSMDQIDTLKSEPSFVVVNDIMIQRHRKERMPVALIILAGIILSAAFGLVPIAVSASAGAVLMALTGCIRGDDIPKAVNWKIIFLLAGVIPLGVAMDKTGAARMISDFILHFLKDMGPHAVLSAFFLVTVMLTEMVSNQATAALLTPVAIQAAQTMDVSARPMIFAIAFAASLSFMTPMGYQTNILVYGPGHYKFKDYTKAGGPLNILFWLLCTFLIPVFWPFNGSPYKTMRVNKINRLHLSSQNRDPIKSIRCAR